jgi:hypothetical protein
MLAPKMLPEPGKQDIASRRKKNRLVVWLERVRDQIIEDEQSPVPLPERHRAATDYFKHLATLSTGSIFLQILLFEKVFTQPKWKGLIALSLISFTLCIIGTVVVYTFALTRSVATRNTGLQMWRLSTTRVALEFLSLCTTWFGFLTGIIALTTFALKNLY